MKQFTLMLLAVVLLSSGLAATECYGPNCPVSPPPKDCCGPCPAR